ncbi:MAG: DNA translocase FtsK [Bacilli bacterium]|nr:DNA translocase FtsK [Bacilli bacterium]
MQETPKRPFRLSKETLSDKRLQYVLIGILLILFALIAVFDRSGFVGLVFSYIFVYLFGATYLGIMAIMLGFGIYFIVKKQRLYWKWNTTSIFALVLVLFALVAFGDNEGTMANLFSDYGTSFKTFMATPGFAVYLNSGTGGGLIGRFFYDLFALILTPIGARILYILAIVAGLFFVIKPLAFFIGEKIVHRNDQVKERDRRKMEEKQRDFNRYFDEREKIFIDQRDQQYEPEEQGIKVEDTAASDLLEPDDKKSDSLSRNRDKGPSLGSRSAIDVFKNNTSQSFNEQTKTVENPTPVPFTSGKSFNIFRDTPINDDVTVATKSSSVPTPSISRDNFHQYHESDGNTQGGVFVPYHSNSIKPTNVQEVEENTADFTSEEEVAPEVMPTPTPEPVVEPTPAPVEPFLQEEKKAEQPTNFTPNEGLFAHPDTPIKEEIPVEVPPAETPQPEQEEEVIPEKKVVRHRGPYKLPSIDLLDVVSHADNDLNNQEARINCAKLNNKLESLGINGKVINHIVAPSFTQYQIETNNDVKISQFGTIKNDLMMALSAVSINIQTPIPGTSYVGIEVPNKIRSAVSFREVFESIQNEDTHKKPLLAAIGKDVMGNVVNIEINKAPHLLIAGATGSGKSVCMNTIIVSILMRETPEDVKLMLVDPKRIELKEYADIPHLLCPVIMDAKKAEVALDKMCGVMEDRYKLFEKYSQRTIESYNDYAAQNGLPKLPYLVIIIDELADLMMQSKHEVEFSIARITQLARAAGIVLIVATQRPSVNVVTGVIKANIPSRIAFAVASQVDSKTILDDTEAANLLGKGDMLLSMQGALGRQRVQGAFVTDEEIRRVVAAIKAQREPEFDPIFMDLEPKQTIEQQSLDVDLGDTKGDDEADLYGQIIGFLSTVDTISISALQRRFRLGFPRAGRLLDQLQDEGLISGPQGAGKQREVLHDAVVARIKAGDEDAS